jgi:DNA-binding response OmpR family regulator
MIHIVSSHPGERRALVALCASRDWVSVDCDSFHAFQRTLRHTPPRVVVTRQRLDDGYSDDVIAMLADAGLLPGTKVVVLLAASGTSAQEARQVTLGADLVQRDPVRTDVLLEYIARYRSHPVPVERKRASPAADSFPFLGAIVQSVERTIHHRGRTATLTPRQVELVELLAAAAGQVVTYQTLYSEILGRKFRGDTSNMRVLLGKLDAALRPVGLRLRRHVEVIPKTGYRYRPAAVTAARQHAA